MVQRRNRGDRSDGVSRQPLHVHSSRRLPLVLGGAVTFHVLHLPAGLTHAEGTVGGQLRLQLVHPRAEGGDGAGGRKEGRGVASVMSCDKGSSVHRGFGMHANARVGESCRNTHTTTQYAVLGN